MPNSKKYYIEPYVYYEAIEETCLFYNTITGESLTFKSYSFAHGLEKILRNKSVLLDSSEIKEEKLINLLHENNFIDQFYSESLSPFIIPVSLNKLEQTNDLMHTINNSIDLFYNLFEVHFILTNKIINRKVDPIIYDSDCHKNENLFDFFVNMFTSNNYNIHLEKLTIDLEVQRYIEIENVLKIFDGFLNLHKVQLNFSMPNDFLSDDLKQISKKIINYPFNFIFFGIGEIQNILIYKDFFIENNCELTFFIKSESEIDLLNNLFSSLPIKLKFLPDLNADNNFLVSFFYLKINDLNKNVSSLDSIQRRRVLNPVDFGHIVIFGEGSYCSNKNYEIIGNVFDSTPIEMVNNCIYSLKSTWLKRREIVKPCMDCIYRNLCPPITGYEYSLDRFDICSISTREKKSYTYLIES